MRYWKRINAKGKITAVESYSHDLDVEGVVEITKKQYNEFIASLPVIEPELERDDSAEIDKLWEEVRKLKEAKDGA